mmetsp:Transcript_14751/g.37907  ORF Transcript_14751/g.37907 Transcript_14751/m.37907 type:complete len:201 (+) Transcript_14751:313-915(+)
MALSDAAQLGDVDGHLLHGIDLIREQLALHKVAHLRVVVLVGDVVQGAQLLEVELLQAQRQLHCIERVALVAVARAAKLGHGRQDALKLHAATALVLVLHEQLGMAALLLGVLLEPGREAGKADVVAVEVGIHGVVDVADVVLDVCLLVDGCLALGVVVGAGKGLIAVGFGDAGADGLHLRERLEHHAGDLGGIRCSAAC